MSDSNKEGPIVTTVASPTKKVVQFSRNVAHEADQRTSVAIKYVNHHHISEDEGGKGSSSGEDQHHGGKGSSPSTTATLAGAPPANELLYGTPAPPGSEVKQVSKMEDLSVLLSKMDKADRRVFTSATINPMSVKQETMNRCGLDAKGEDWSKAAWGRIPALENLKHLSILTRFDIEAPINTATPLIQGGNNDCASDDASQQQLQLLSSGPPVAKTNASVAVTTTPHPPVRSSIIPFVPNAHSIKPHMREPDSFVLSDIGRRIPAAENVRINIALDIRLVRDVQELVNTTAVRDDNITTTVLRMKHLLGLGRSQQTMGTSSIAHNNHLPNASVDQWVRDICYRVALSHPSHGGGDGKGGGSVDEVDLEQQRIINILLQSNLQFLPVSSAISRDRRPESTGSREQRTLFRERQPVDHNRGFYSSDVASYPGIRPIYADEESAAILEVGPPTPRLALRERRDIQDDNLPTTAASSPTTSLTDRSATSRGAVPPSQSGRRHTMPKPPRFSQQRSTYPPTAAHRDNDESSSSSDEDTHATRSIFTSAEAVANTIERRRKAQQFPSIHQRRLSSATTVVAATPDGRAEPNASERPQALKTWMERQLEVPPISDDGNETQSHLTDAMAQYAAVLERADLAAVENRVQVLQHEVNVQRRAIKQEEDEILRLEQRSRKSLMTVADVPSTPTRELLLSTTPTNPREGGCDAAPPSTTTTPTNPREGGCDAAPPSTTTTPLSGTSLYSQVALLASPSTRPTKGMTDLDRTERRLALEKSLITKQHAPYTIDGYAHSNLANATPTHSPVRPVGARRPASHAGTRVVQPTTTRVELPIKPAEDDDEVDPHLPHCDPDKNTDVDRHEYKPFMDQYLSRQSTLRRHYNNAQQQLTTAGSPLLLVEGML